MISNLTRRFSAVIFLALFALVVSIALIGIAAPTAPAGAAGYGIYPTIRVVGGASGTTTYANTGTVNLATTSWLNYETVDAYVAVDITDANTVTVKTQSSADAITWVDATTIVNATGADTSVTSRANAVGAYYRFVLVSTTAATYTPTIKVVLK